MAEIKSISDVIHQKTQSRPMIYAYLANTTDIEKSLALEFIGNDGYKYNGFLGNY